MITKDEMLRLQKMKWDVMPICIPSYMRYERKSNKTLTSLIEKCDEEIQKNTYVFVRREQAEQYKESFPSVNIISLPEINGLALATTRQYMQDFVAYELKQPYCVDMDDDINDLKFVYHENGKDHLSKSGEVNPSLIFRLAFEFSRMAFEKNGCVFGNIHRVRFANTFPASQMAYVVNRGATPRQVTFVNVKELTRIGVKRNPAFNVNGDDVGFIAEISKYGKDFFQIPSLAYSFVDDSTNSVIRNSKNIKAKSAYTYNQLQNYPMKNFLRSTITFDDGSFKFGDIDYSAYCKIYNRPSGKVSIENFKKYKGIK